MALPPKKGQAAPAGRVNNYLEEMAADAQQAAEQETKPASGQFISFKNCEITVDGVKLPGAQMAFVLLDGILENRDFEFDYDAENLRNPRCFAFGRAAKEMTHHEMSEQPQSMASALSAGPTSGSPRPPAARRASIARKFAVSPSSRLASFSTASSSRSRTPSTTSGRRSATSTCRPPAWANTAATSTRSARA